MNTQAEALRQRTKQFALEIIAFVRTLPNNDTANVVGRQVLRSATGLGANYRAACRARSRADFVSKIGIALEEADESGFWLELVAEGRLSSSKVVYQLLEEANQLSAIFAASRITAAEALRHERQRPSI
jgi:four helix bundle protein